jgi:membrane dipeptidase
VIDMLGLLTTDWSRLSGWHADPASFTSADLALMKASGINVFHPAVDLNGPRPFQRTEAWLKHWNTFLDAHPESFVRISCCEDLEKAKSDGRIGVMLGMQNSAHFESVSDVAHFYGLGQRLSQLTYNGPNRIGHGCIGEDPGLSEFGGSVVSAMNASRMIVDVSHAGERTSLGAFEHSKAPVVITHANCKALNPHPRCKSDAVIQGMARTGGVMGITSIRAFVRGGGRATVEDALNHFDHAIRIAGVEHVGLGSDTDLGSRPGLDVAGLNHPRRVFDLTEGLVRRRYTEAHIEMILGRNFQRVISDVLCTPAGA